MHDATHPGDSMSVLRASTGNIMSRYYMPAITGDKDPSAWYDELTAVLQNSTLTTPTPPKDPGDCLADSALARSPQVFCMLAARTPRRRMSVPSFMQRVRLITLTLLCTRVAAKKSSKSASSKEVGLHQVPDAGLQAMDFRYNPRWCLAGRPLETLGQSRSTYIYICIYIYLHLHLHVYIYISIYLYIYV